MQPLPTVLLRPGEADRIIAGHPWIYSGSVLRLTNPAEDGAMVQIKDHRQRFLGVGLYNSKSKINERVIAPEKVELNRAFFVERIRAGGCGLGGVLTPTGVGTLVAEGKRQIEVEGTTFLLETALRAKFALVHAFLADYLGNLTYALTARNFNPIMAMAADTVIVTAEHIVPVGVIAPDHVVTPAPLVDYLITNG